MTGSTVAETEATDSFALRCRVQPQRVGPPGSARQPSGGRATRERPGAGQAAVRKTGGAATMRSAALESVPAGTTQKLYGSRRPSLDRRQALEVRGIVRRCSGHTVSGFGVPQRC